MGGKFPDTRLSTQIFFSTLTLLLQRGASLEKHPSVLYTCQLFPSYKREIFILGGPTLVDNISAIVLKSESFGLTWSIFMVFVPYMGLS